MTLDDCRYILINNWDDVSLCRNCAGIDESVELTHFSRSEIEVDEGHLHGIHRITADRNRCLEIDDPEIEIKQNLPTLTLHKQ